jgi:PBSX family phage terminase large subunit
MILRALILMAIVIASGNVQASPENRPYQPFGAALTAFYDRGPEILLSGPAGTGKSRAILEKLHLCANKWPGMRGLIVRKTRASLSESGLVTFEEKVLPARSPVKGNTQRRYRQVYQYLNGSELVVAGMDDPNRVMSTEYDMVVALEATELTETDWEQITTRLRNFVMPFQQLLADCNPGSPNHWLKARADRQVARLLNSTHEDNPAIFDQKSRTWTEQGKAYLRTLGNLTGVRRLRLLKGIWAMAEGMVYADVWQPAVHLVDRFDVPKDWRRFWVVDFGFTNPFCWQAWAMDNDGRLYRFAEIYRTKRLVEDHAMDILAWQKENNESDPEVVICDHDAEDRATFEKHSGLGTIAAVKSVSDGIQAVAGRMKIAGDDKARLFLLRDSLVSRDTDLQDKKLPTCTEEEIEGYVWNEKKDVPVKEHDHGCDAMRYVVMHCEQSSNGVFF